MAVENTHYGAERITELLRGCRSLYFIGVGGISMSALAMLSRHEGYAVGGSDRTASRITESLINDGIDVCIGHSAERILQYDAVIYTVAIAADNPEYLAARAAGKPLISRADYLGYLMHRFSKRIGVAGMHGKSTCTAMCASILLEAGDPTVLCGASLASLGDSPCRIGRGREHFLFEACEYMDSFLDFYPTVAVILNIGLDHVDYFHSMEQIRESFLRYAERVGKDGAVLYNADDPECVQALREYEGRRMTFAIDASADFTARNASSSGGVTEFDFCIGEETVARLRVTATGRHNLYNALAAAAAASLAGASAEQIGRGLSQYTGAHRRMEKKGRLPSGAVVFDDYAHHPDEICATLAGAAELGYRRILCAYQPHTYSRTAGLFREFAGSFGGADKVFFADIYAAREQNVYGVSSEQLAGAIGEKATYCGSFDAVAKAILGEAQEGDLVLVMGAGDIGQVFSLLPLSDGPCTCE